MHGTTSNRADTASPPAAPASDAGTRLAARIRARGFRGEIVEDPEHLGRYARDYGRRIGALPRLVVLPRDTADVQRVFAMAASGGLPLRLRGEGNALAGQSLVEGGLVVATRDLRLASGATMEIDPSGDGAPRARLSAGLSWSEATMRLADAGYRMAVAVLCGQPSVGGTLSAGGIGLGSHAFGAQIDTVLDAEIVTPDARLVSTAAMAADGSAHPALGGHGQFGLITAVTVPLVPIGERLWLDRYVFSDFAGLASALQDIAAAGIGIIGLWGVVNRGAKTGRLQYQVNVARGTKTSGAGAPAVAGASDAQSVSIPWSEFARHTPADWQPTLFPAWAEMTFGNHDDMTAFVQRHPRVLDTLRPGDIVSCIPVRRRPRSTATLSCWPDVPEGSLMVSLGLFSFRATRTEAERLTRWQYDLHGDAAQSFGATNYAISCLPRSKREWGDHLGARRRAVADARRSVDPGGLIAPLSFLDDARALSRER